MNRDEWNERYLTGNLPWADLLNCLTGWDLSESELLLCGERIQNLRAAFNWREGLAPADFAPHPRMMGEGDGLLGKGPLRGIRVPLLEMRKDYHEAMHWNPATGRLHKEQADKLGMTQILGEYVDG